MESIFIANPFSHIAHNPLTLRFFDMATTSCRIRSFVAIFILLTFHFLPLRALEKQVMMEEVPFSPCNTVNINVFNTSRLSDQMSGVKKGEKVNVLAWAEGERDVLVELIDGSRGYMPAAAFIAGGVEVNIPGNTHMACVYYNIQGSEKPRLHFYLPEGRYRIVDAWWWDIGKTSLEPRLMVAQSVANGEKYFVANEEKAPSYSGLNIRSLLTGDLKNLPLESIAKKQVFFDDGNKHLISRYLGCSREILESTLGEPDASINASRSKKGRTELFYRNICFVEEMWDKRNVILGAVFYLDKDDIVRGASMDSYLSLPRKKISYVLLPKPGETFTADDDYDKALKKSMWWNDFFEDVNHIFDVGAWGTPLVVIFLSFLLSLIQWILLRLGWKRGSNKTVCITSFLFIALPLFLFTRTFLDTYSSLINWINVILVFAGAFCFTPWRLIDHFRCECCGEYVPKRNYVKIEYGPVLQGKYRKEVRIEDGVRYDYYPVDNNFIREQKTCYETWEEREYTYYHRDKVYFKGCPKCGYEWTYTESEIVNSEKSGYEVLRRYTEEAVSSAVFGDLIDPETGKCFTVMRYADGSMVDSNGDVYTDGPDGIQKTDGHVFGHIF